MQLVKLLEIKPGITAVMGSGGKTTLLRVLGEELAERYSVLLCTNTKIRPFPGMPCAYNEEELEVLRKLLPEPVKESDICDFVQGYAIDRNWVGTDDVSTRVMIPKKNMGEVIKATKSQFPTADGKIISEIVKVNLE